MSGENNKYIRSNHKASIINQGDRKTRARGQCEFHYSLFFSRKKIPRFGKECAKNGFAFHAICVCLQRRNLKGPRAKKDGLILRHRICCQNFFLLASHEKNFDLGERPWTLDGKMIFRWGASALTFAENRYDKLRSAASSRVRYWSYARQPAAGNM